MAAESSENNIQLSASDEIEKLHSLKEKGIISEEEFQQKRNNS